MFKLQKAYVTNIVVILMVLTLIVGCSPTQKDSMDTSTSPAAKQANSQEKSIIYTNTQYGFSFALPASWSGYTIVTDKWEGVASETSQGNQANITGPMILIRHPLWTAKNPRQDIPIMIFTLDQWNLLQQDKFHIGAAPIQPSELGRNSKYVFALPARYNFAFLTGYEEVESILNSNPLHGIEDK